jgi:hypothetical protein
MATSVGSVVFIWSGPFTGCTGIVVETNAGIWVRLRDSGVVVHVKREDVGR